MVKGQDVDAISKYLADVANSDPYIKMSKGTKIGYSKKVDGEIHTILDEAIKHDVNNEFILELLNNIGEKYEFAVFNRAVKNNLFTLIEDLINMKKIHGSDKTRFMLSVLIDNDYFEKHLEKTRGLVSLIEKKTKGTFSARIGFDNRNLTAFNVLLEYVPSDYTLDTYVIEAMGVILDSWYDEESKKFARSLLNDFIDKKKIAYDYVLAEKGYKLIGYMANKGQIDYVKRIVKAFDLSVDDLNKKDSAGWTVLMDASNDIQYDVVEYLINLGVDKSIKNSDGKTAYVIAQGASADERLLQLLK
jgi:hypothetical protein